MQHPPQPDSAKAIPPAMTRRNLIAYGADRQRQDGGVPPPIIHHLQQTSPSRTAGAGAGTDARVAAVKMPQQLIQTRSTYTPQPGRSAAAAWGWVRRTRVSGAASTLIVATPGRLLNHLRNRCLRLRHRSPRARRTESRGGHVASCPIQQRSSRMLQRGVQQLLLPCDDAAANRSGASGRDMRMRNPATVRCSGNQHRPAASRHGPILPPAPLKAPLGRTSAHPHGTHGGRARHTDEARSIVLADALVRTRGHAVHGNRSAGAADQPRLNRIQEPARLRPWWPPTSRRAAWTLGASSTSMCPKRRCSVHSIGRAEGHRRSVHARLAPTRASRSGTSRLS